MFKLHVYSQSGDLDQEVEIPGDEATIGRSHECHVVIDRKDISRVHARLLRGWVVDDLGSRNGTHVEGRKIEQATLVAAQCFEVGDPTGQNLVRIEVVQLPGAPSQHEETAAANNPAERTTAPLPPEGEATALAALRAEFEAKTERYRFQCAKLELELESLRSQLGRERGAR